ncbi:hypothetical protein GWI33_009824, partial [Rhynchophorus ferrugineus]
RADGQRIFDGPLKNPTECRLRCRAGFRCLEVADAQASRSIC